MPYLVCKKCKGYYILQEGESLEDFEECECGGKLKQAESLNIPYNTERVKTIVETFNESFKSRNGSSNDLEENKKLSINVDYTQGLDRLLKEDKASKGDISVHARRLAFKEVALIPELYNIDYVDSIDDYTKSQIIEILADIVYQGRGIIDATNEILSETELTYDDAEKISKNELSRIKNLGNWYVHKEKGYKYFKIAKALDACEICRKSYNNMKFNIDQVEMLPPLHNLCKCNAMFYKK